MTSGGTSVATAINNAGEVVGYSVATTGIEHGFKWTSGTLTDLGTESGGSFSQANAVNDAGQIAGTADRSISSLPDSITPHCDRLPAARILVAGRRSFVAWAAA